MMRALHGNDDMFYICIIYIIHTILKFYALSVVYILFLRYWIFIFQDTVSKLEIPVSWQHNLTHVQLISHFIIISSSFFLLYVWIEKKKIWHSDQMQIRKSSICCWRLSTSRGCFSRSQIVLTFAAQLMCILSGCWICETSKYWTGCRTAANTVSLIWR